MNSPGLELNDLGFLSNTDEVLQVLWAGYSFNEPFSIFREVNVNGNQWRGWDFSGENIFDGGNVNGGAKFKNCHGTPSAREVARGRT